jgi:hypothetical protein
MPRVNCGIFFTIIFSILGLRSLWNHFPFDFVKSHYFVYQVRILLVSDCGCSQWNLKNRPKIFDTRAEISTNKKGELKKEPAFQNYFRNLIYLASGIIR